MGSDTYGNLGTYDRGAFQSPVQVGSVFGMWSAMSDSPTRSQTIVAKVNGTAWGWGNNFFGELGIISTIDKSSPTQIGALTNWLKFSSGTQTNAIKANGTLWGWGNNTDGQAGTPVAGELSSPIQIGALSTWNMISSGTDRKSTRLNSSHIPLSRMPSSA